MASACASSACEGYVLRIEVAHSREHAARLIFSAGGAF